MTIAKLSIDLEARLAGLQAGLNKAVGLAEGAAGRIEGSFSALKSIAPTVLAGFSVAAVAGFTRQVVNGLDELNDAADATGSSIEKLSALEDIAARNGTAFGVVTDAVVRFNKALADAKQGSEGARIFEQLGLSVEELKRLDPAEAFQRTAIALSRWADDGNKARAVQELFGKSLKEVAPLLKDVADKGQLVATVTTEQARAAEALNKEWSALKKNSEDLARVLAGPLITGFNSLFDYSRKLAATIRENGLAGAIKKDMDNAIALGKVMNDPKVRALIDYGYANPGNEGRDRPKPTLAVPDKPDKAAGAKAAADRLKLAQFAAEQIVKLEEITAQETVEAWSYVNKSVMDLDKERTDALRTQWQQVFASIDQQQDDAIEQGRQFLEAERTRLDAAKTAKDAGQEIGLVFASAAGQAITQWSGVRNLFKGILADVAQIGLKMLITKPLENAIGGFLGSTLGGLFGSAKGNAFGASGVIPFASGGIVDSPTLFRFAKGTGLMGEAGPEAIMPLKRGRDGKLGVAGAGGLTYAPVIHIDSRTDRAQVAALVAQANQQGQQQMLQYLQAQGVM